MNQERYSESWESRVAHAEMHAPGIEWTDFNRKKKSRMALLWIKRSVVVVLLGSAIFAGVQSLHFRNVESHKSDLHKQSDLELSHSSPAESTNAVQGGENKGPAGQTGQLFGKTPDPFPGTVHPIPVPIFVETAEAYPTATDFEIPQPFGLRLVQQRAVIGENAKLEEPIPHLLQKIVKPLAGDLYLRLQAGTSLNMPRLNVTDAGRAFIHKDYETIRRNSEFGMAGFGLQAALQRRLHDWTFSLGLGYAFSEIRGSYDFIYNEKPVIDVDGRIISYAVTSPVNVKFSSLHKISFVEIPLQVQYIFLKSDKYATGIQLGYIPQFLNRINGEMPNAVLLDHRELMRNVNYRGFGQVFELGLPVYRDLTDASGFAVTPYFRWHGGLSQAQSLYRTYLNNWGISGSYILKF